MPFTSCVSLQFSSYASSSTSLRPRQAEIEGDHEEHTVDYIYDVKIDNRPRRRGPYLQFLTHFLSFDIPEMLLLEQVDDYEQFSLFSGKEKWNTFFKGKDYLDFANNIAMRMVMADK